jgi:hypothetical protein
MKETLLLFGIFGILTTIATTIHGSSFDSSDHTFQTEAQQIALSSAQQLLDQVANAEFDEKTIGVSQLPPDSALTPAAAFGMEAGEILRDDVDDYANLTVPGDSTRYPGFFLHVHVAYADMTNPLNDAAVQTRFKRITVTVSNDKFLKDPIEMSTIVSSY